MEAKYVVNESTLTEIADAIRYQEKSSDHIETVDFAKRIEAIEPSVEEYMRISDYINYPIALNELNYTAEDIDECATLIKFYAEMEETNG